MKANLRHSEILRTLVREYIENNQPISSSGLVDKTGLNVSSATMRNELSFLEKEGYVQHVHTSSGRIPTDKGYRFFVDNLIDKFYTPEETKYIHDQLSGISTRMDKILLYMAQLLGEIAKYPVIVVIESERKAFLKYIQLVLLNMHQILLLVLDNYGQNYEEIIPYDAPISASELGSLNQVLNHTYGNLSFEDLSFELNPQLEAIRSKFNKHQSLFDKVLSSMANSKSVFSDRQIIVENRGGLLAYPEFHEIDALQNVQSILGDSVRLGKIFEGKEFDDPVKTYIGSEHSDDQLSSTSLIFSDLEIEGNKIAKIGLLGPTRMKYEKNFGRISCLKETVENKFRELFF